MAPSGVSTLLEAVKKGLPDVLVKRRLNFITIHYLYICGMIIFWSAIFYAIGGVPYVDALFFTSGGSTQSGLNTVDVNLLKTGQQALLYFLAMMCNPIVIHSSVVFVRLYWFEKRFKDVVREARQLRRTRSKSRQRRGSFLSEDAEAGRTGVSVRGRAIQLLQSTGHRPDGRKNQQAKSDAPAEEKHVDSSDTSQDQHSETSEKPPQRRSTSLDDVRLPQQMNAEQHIRFLENQRNPQDSTTLRIPSPREFDRGGRVQSIDERSEELGRQTTRLHGDEMSPEIAGAPRVAQHITFNEPDVPAHQRNAGRVTTFPRVETGKASTIDPRTYDEDPMLRGRSHTRRNSGTGLLRTNTARTMEAAPYLSWQPTVARNSFFVNLTEEQREELGGIEYRSLKTLALILLGYFFCFHLFAIVCFTPWIYTTHYGSSVTAVGQGRAWWGVFTAQSIFNDVGYTLTPDSMVQFQTSSFVMLLGAYLIIIGNTGFPCMLRFVIWVLSKFVPVGSGLWEELQFLLDHPRRCFTLLFPRAATWWLFAILVILNGVDLLLFIILDLNDDTVTHLSPWTRITVGLFQASATRTAGFSAVNLADLHPGVQVSYMIMMYISVFPIAISMRRTNVYEEKSLGIYAGASDESDDAEPSYVGAHLRKQLGFDLWYVVLGLFIIAIVEGGRIGNNNEYAFTLWAILFEIISAYGTVGLSMGYPGYNTSFSGQFKTLSKLVIIAMQIRGRHRGLPYELDRAILLPSEGLHRKEAQEGDKIVQRRRTSLSRYDTNPAAPRQGPNGAPASTTSYDHAVDGLDERENEDHIGPRQRRLTNQSTAASTESQGKKSRRGRLRRGLGNAMFKVAAGPEEVIEEEAEKKPK